jgi:hypothetical protein
VESPQAISEFQQSWASLFFLYDFDPAVHGTITLRFAKCVPVRGAPPAFAASFHFFHFIYTHQQHLFGKWTKAPRARQDAELDLDSFCSVILW